MHCVECGCEKDTGERGWVTVLAPGPTPRIHFCPDCMADLLRHACGEDDEAAGA